MVEYRSNRDLWKDLNRSYCATTFYAYNNHHAKHKIIAITQHIGGLQKEVITMEVCEGFQIPLHPIHRNNF